ncbi:MAG: PilZ domain-containing protein [Deltaproteobacteria bacterium]|nr:PilZ domain-containing protein [Deltaproteobacteria bacterium]
MTNLFYSNAYALDTGIDVGFFSKTGASEGSNTYFFIGLAVLIIVLGLVFYIHKIRSKNQFLQAQKNYQKKRQEMLIQTQNISDDAGKDIDYLAKMTAADISKLIDDHKYYEKMASKFAKKFPHDPFITRISQIRQELGFTFDNQKAKFITSKMLLNGQKVRVGVKYKGKAHNYVGTILNTFESEFWVKPPTVKGKVIDLTQFRHLQFRVYRKNDGEYSFQGDLISQITKPVNAIVVPHSDKIKRLRLREQDRYEISFEKKFYFLLPDAGKGDDATKGIVQDLSVGGIKMSVENLPSNVIVGTNIVLDLSEADIKNEIQASIVRINTAGTENYIHMQFNNLSELNRLNLQKFIAGKKAKKLAEK